MNQEAKLTVSLFSDGNFLALSILETLLSKNFLVNVITEETEVWRLQTKNLNKTRFGITLADDFSEAIKYNYFIYCGGFTKKENFLKKIKWILSLENIKNVKGIILLPFEKFSLQNSFDFPLNDNISVVYLGDLLGPRFNLDGNLFIEKIINQIVLEKTFNVGIGEIFYPMFVPDVARVIAKWLFSFGPYGHELFLLGAHTSATDFWKANKKFIPDLEITFDEKEKPRFFPRGYEVEILEGDLDASISETYNWLKKSLLPKTPVSKTDFVKPKPKTKKTKPRPKFLFPVLLSTFVILTLPIFILLISYGLLYVSYKNMFEKGKDFENLALASKTLFTVGKVESDILAKVPVVKIIYRESSFLFEVGKASADIYPKVSEFTKNSKDFFGNILGDNVYDPEIKAKIITNDLSVFENRLTQISDFADVSSRDGSIIANYVLGRFDLEKYKNMLKQGQVITAKLPEILGKDKRKSYLVLFQNNMELRPTGGFIGSFGIFNFDGGRLVDMNVSDVYSADGQLKGHVEPPSPIKDYLGEANWFLRDSNWDPDFPTSAKRAEWFLDKELSQQVDGAVSVDLNLVRDLLKITGPVFLPDYNLNIDSENLYVKTQSEVQDNFFPGTRKKASFLTALSRNLISEIGKTKEENKAKILKSMLSNLEGRHIQIYLHDDAANQAFSSIGFSGGVLLPYCGEGCYSDFTGLVEANLGVNKANYFIQRSVNLNVNLDGGKVVRELTVNFTNNANPALGLAGKYKVYLRLLVPKDASVLDVEQVGAVDSQKINYDTIDARSWKEVGILTEILGKQSTKIKFSWQNDLTGGLSNYGLYVRKQSGVSDDPWTVSISPPVSSLTKRGIQTYNTILRQDFTGVVSF